MALRRKAGLVSEEIVNHRHLFTWLRTTRSLKVRLFFKLFSNQILVAHELLYLHGIIHSLNVEEHFLTLVKLRQHETNFELSRMFSLKPR